MKKEAGQDIGDQVRQEMDKIWKAQDAALEKLMSDVKQRFERIGLDFVRSGSWLHPQPPLGGKPWDRTEFSFSFRVALDADQKMIGQLVEEEFGMFPRFRGRIGFVSNEETV